MNAKNPGRGRRRATIALVALASLVLAALAVEIGARVWLSDRIAPASRSLGVEIVVGPTPVIWQAISGEADLVIRIPEEKISAASCSSGGIGVEADSTPDGLLVRLQAPDGQLPVPVTIMLTPVNEEGVWALVPAYVEVGGFQVSPDRLNQVLERDGVARLLDGISAPRGFNGAQILAITTDASALEFHLRVPVREVVGGGREGQTDVDPCATS